MMPVHLVHPVTQRLLLIAGISGLVMLVFWKSFVSMWTLWQTAGHSYGLLVFPISAFLVWRLRHQLMDIPVAVYAPGLLGLTVLALGWIGTKLAGIQTGEHLVVLAMIPMLVTVLAGVRMARTLLFPLLFLLLATPFSDSLVPFLMQVTADISTFLLKLTGFPLVRNGQYISLPGGEFVVADVCSGVRYLSTGVLVALLFGYLTFVGFGKRTIFVVLTALALVIANGIRAYIVMAVASLTHMEYFGGRDHIYFGWLLFGGVMMLIMWAGAHYGDEPQSPASEAPEVAVSREPGSAVPVIVALGLVMLALTVNPLQAAFGGAAVAVSAALIVLLMILVRYTTNVSRESVSHEVANFRFKWRSAVTACAAIVILLWTPRFVAGVEHRAVDSIHSIALGSTLSCGQEQPWQESWEPRFREPDFSTSATFICGTQRISVFVAAYASALQGHELISSAHFVVPRGWDRTTSVSKQVFEAEDRQEIGVVESRLEVAGNPAVVWHWYEIDGRVTSRPLAAKVLQLWALARGRPAGGRVVVLVLNATPSTADLRNIRDNLAMVAKQIIGAGTHIPVTQDAA